MVGGFYSISEDNAARLPLIATFVFVFAALYGPGIGVSCGDIRAFKVRAEQLLPVAGAECHGKRGFPIVAQRDWRSL